MLKEIKILLKKSQYKFVRKCNLLYIILITFATFSCDKKEILQNHKFSDLSFKFQGGSGNPGESLQVIQHTAFNNQNFI